MLKRITAWLRQWYPLLFLTLLASALRIHLLFVRGTLWFDEIFSVHFSSLPWRDAIRYWVLETNPPLYTFFLRYYLPLINIHHETLIRFPSLIFGIASIIILYVFAERRFGRATAIFASLFLTLCNVHILESTEARAYSLLTLLTILSLYFFTIVVFEKKPNTRFLVALGITNLLFLSAHLTALPIFALECAMMIGLATSQSERYRWLAPQLLAFISWLIWFVPFLIGKATVDISSGWYWHSAEDANANLLSLLLGAFTSIQENISLTIFSCLLLFTLGYSINRLRQRPFDYFQVFLAAGALLPPIASLMLGVGLPKYLLTSYIFLQLLVALALDSMSKNQGQYLAVGAAIIILLLPAAITIANRPVFSWQPMTNYIERQENEHSITIVSFPDDFAFRQYYHGFRPVIPSYLGQDTLPIEERIVRYNWSPQATSADEVTSWLDKKIKQFQPDKIFFIEQSANQENFMHTAFRRLGWQEEAHPEYLVGYYHYGFYVLHPSPNVCATAAVLRP